MILQSQPAGTDAWLVMAAPPRLLGPPSSELAQSEPTVVLPGGLIDLGGGTTLTVRED